MNDILNENINLIKGYFGQNLMCDCITLSGNKEVQSLEYCFLNSRVMKSIVPRLRNLQDLTDLEIEKLYLLFYPHNGLYQVKERKHIIQKIERSFKSGYLPIVIVNYLCQIHIDYQNILTKFLSKKDTRLIKFIATFIKAFLSPSYTSDASTTHITYKYKEIFVLKSLSRTPHGGMGQITFLDLEYSTTFEWDGLENFVNTLEFIFKYVEAKYNIKIVE